MFQKSKGKTSCKFATYPDILVTKGKNLVPNGTLLVAISSPDMLRFVFNPFTLFFPNFPLENKMPGQAHETWTYEHKLIFYANFRAIFIRMT